LKLQYYAAKVPHYLSEIIISTVKHQKTHGRHRGHSLLSFLFDFPKKTLSRYFESFCLCCF